MPAAEVPNLQTAASKVHIHGLLDSPGLRLPTVIGLLGCVLFAAVPAAAQQERVVNGGFEAGGKAGVELFPGWDQIGPADNHSNYGVAKSGAAPDVASQGGFYAYFHGNPTDSSQDCLGQTLHLTPGAHYTIRYDLATDGPTLGSGATMWAVIGTSFGIDLSQDVMLTAWRPEAAAAQPYRTFTTEYVATNATVILSFHGINAASSFLLDNVSVTPAPPRLNIALSQNNTLNFTWPLWAATARLQNAASPDASFWTTLPAIPTSNAGVNQIALPAAAGAQFYRLTLP
jgi:hypothetical protein